MLMNSECFHEAEDCKIFSCTYTITIYIIIFAH